MTLRDIDWTADHTTISDQLVERYVEEHGWEFGDLTVEQIEEAEQWAERTMRGVLYCPHDSV